jgi:hypothetical protein
MESLQQPEATNTKPTTATRRRSKVKDLIAQYQHDEKLCRYKNKLCMNFRARKRRGGLHTFCEMHREAANRNQRRLDQRKRIQKRELEAGILQGINPIKSSLVTRHTDAMDYDSQLYPDTILDTEMLSPGDCDSDTSIDESVTQSAMGTSVVPEPSHTPVALKEEDIHALRWLFAVDEKAVQIAGRDLARGVAVKADPARMQLA